MPIYKVIETSHDAADSDRSVADYATRHEAIIHCAKSMKAHLLELVEPGMSAKDLLSRWQQVGLGYRIDPEDSDAPFCDIDYARLYVLRLTNDYSHPLFFEVSTVDCLRTASGITSPKKTWKFWVKAPSAYEGNGLDALMQAGAQALYDDMSQKSMATDGSRYEMLEMTYREVGEEEALSQMRGDPNAIVYFVQNDGSFGRNMPKKP